MTFRKRTSQRVYAQTFVPCAPELAYCSDCQQNRLQGHCPRQKALRHGGKDFAKSAKIMVKKNIEH